MNTEYIISFLNLYYVLTLFKYVFQLLIADVERGSRYEKCIMFRENWENPKGMCHRIEKSGVSVNFLSQFPQSKYLISTFIGWLTFGNTINTSLKWKTYIRFYLSFYIYYSDQQQCKSCESKIVERPVQLPCGDIICANCYRETSITGPTKCPVCHNEFKEDFKPGSTKISRYKEIRLQIC